MPDEDKTVRIAVWNIYGPPPGEQFKTTARKINAFQAAAPDIAFYLEAPSDDASALPGIQNEKWEDSLYAQAEPNNPRGVLAIQYRKNSRIKMQCFQIDPGKTAVGVSILYDGIEKLRVLAVWTTPGKTGQKDYLERLKAIVADYRGKNFFTSENNKIPCIVIGDTNVNLSAGAADPEKTIADSCGDNIDGIKEICGTDLEIWNQGIESNTLRKKITITHENGIKEKVIRWYRCDLMLISKGNHPVSAWLGELEYRDRQGMCGSDHRPIIFEFSLD